jgi:hypothetical protein
MGGFLAALRLIVGLLSHVTIFGMSLFPAAAL